MLLRECSPYDFPLHVPAVPSDASSTGPWKRAIERSSAIGDTGRGEGAETGPTSIAKSNRYSRRQLDMAELLIRLNLGRLDFQNCH